ncbi:MAG TPA: PLDc N-terminal domain-containing protein [Pengzhenrongella sp.]
MAAAVQFALAVAAWVDLATRPANRVNGRKAVWAALIGVNFVGPIAYFTQGRRSAG